MSQAKNSNKRLVKNTLFLYARTLILLIIGVFTSRITLEALGVDNYGTVNVVGGFVSMFSLISAGLTAACQRFITFELGSKSGKVNEVFNTSVHIHIGLCIVILLLAESLGLYFVSHKLDIPDAIQPYVQWVYQCSVISFLLSIINIPYNAIIIAYERFNVFAIISLLEGILKLGVVLLLLYIPGIKLVIYALLTLSASIIIRGCYQIYTRITFRHEVRIHKSINPTIGKKLFGFAGWSFIGNSAVIFSNQGVNVILNLFCGVVLNAARGIATIVESVITNFVNNFTMALNPQITKAYAIGDQEALKSKVFLGLRITYYLMLLIGLPVIIVAHELLGIWYTTVPDFTVIFVRLAIIVATIQGMGNPFVTVMLATGKIRDYQLVVGGITFLNFPVSYIALYVHINPIVIYLIAIIIACCTFIIRLIYVQRYTEIKVKHIINIIISRFLILLVLGTLGGYGWYKILPVTNIWNLLLYLSVSCLTIGTILFVLGLSKNERRAGYRILQSKLLRI